VKNSTWLIVSAVDEEIVKLFDEEVIEQVYSENAKVLFK
jgi:hypothetical protein